MRLEITFSAEVPEDEFERAVVLGKEGVRSAIQELRNSLTEAGAKNVELKNKTTAIRSKASVPALRAAAE